LLAFAGSDDLHQVGLKVWQNECHGTLDGLVSWNPHEEFPSLGLGHFIWYPANALKKYEETFPALIEFLSEKLKNTEKTIPSWIKSKKGCPWKTREAFLQEARGKKVRELREFLADTLDLQIAFIFERYKEAEQQLLPHLTAAQKNQLDTLKKSPQGIYALVDYINFKGIGLNPNERYRGQGWGLLQLLQNIPEETADEKLIDAFIVSGKKTLAKRIKNAPAQKGEERWLKGWYTRLESYGKFN